MTTTDIDIRYTLTKKPYVAVLDSSTNYHIQANMLRDAGFVECYSGNKPLLSAGSPDSNQMSDVTDRCLLKFHRNSIEIPLKTQSFTFR
jgi:hypothetical protein